MRHSLQYTGMRDKKNFQLFLDYLSRHVKVLDDHFSFFYQNSLRHVIVAVAII